MQTKVFERYACCLVAGGLYTLLQQPAQAAEFYKGWNYVIDSPNDSLGTRPDESIQPGGSIYEIFGMSFKDDVATDSVWFAVSANLPLYGDNLANPFLSVNGEEYPVPDSNIGWGDLILDFSGSSSLKTASDAKQLIGIKFSINNDSLVPTLGVYSGASVASVTTTNAGFSNLANNNNVLSSSTGGTRSASMGDLAWNDSYFAPYTTTGSYGNPASWMPNVLSSGSKIGEATLLNRENLIKAGLDPSFSGLFSPTGSEIFGFRIPKALLPVGDFIATLLTECINDGIALQSKLVPPAPPPPAPYVCPVTMGQQNALMPTQVIDGVRIFENAPSGAWFDPPANQGFQFTAQGGSLFTGISGFPCAILPDEPRAIQTSAFNVLVKDSTGNYQIMGQYFPGQSVDFTQLPGGGVSEFLITGISSGWRTYPPENDPLAFALLLNQETANIAYRKITDTSNLPVPAITVIPSDGVPEVPGSIRIPITMPGITELPPITGPELDPPCLEEGRCGAVPEPSTIAGIVFAAAGLLKLRRNPRQK
jgi:hypothetical protein